MELDSNCYVLNQYAILLHSETKKVNCAKKKNYDYDWLKLFSGSGNEKRGRPRAINLFLKQINSYGSPNTLSTFILKRAELL